MSATPPTVPQATIFGTLDEWKGGEKVLIKLLRQVIVFPNVSLQMKKTNYKIVQELIRKDLIGASFVQQTNNKWNAIPDHLIDNWYSGECDYICAQIKKKKDKQLRWQIKMFLHDSMRNM